MRALRRLLLAIALCVSTTAAAQVSCLPSLDEESLLHLEIAPSLLSKVQLWNHQQAEWQAPMAEQVPMRRAPVVVMHLWADWCGPCKTEMPLLRTQIQELAAQHRERLEFVFMTESNRSVELARYMIGSRERMPRVAYYLDIGEAVARLLRTNLPSGQLSLPITLLLDEQRVVRQAFVGPLAPRWPELQRGVARLVQLSSRRSGAPR
jgi:thiol-disulfide isomerase/thioredoxin